MSSTDGPRLLRPGEFDEMTALIDRYFAFERQGMAARLPYVYDRDRPERHGVIAVDDEIVSQAACVPRTLVIGDARVECASIGGVCTAKPHRGTGYMSQLLTFWLDWMAEASIPLANLGGNRERYGHFGFELGGREVSYTLTSRSVPDHDVPGAVRVLDGGFDEIDVDPDDVATLHELYATHDLRVARDSELTRTVLGQRGLETLLYEDGNTRAYLSLTRERRERTVTEFGGDPKGLRALTAYLFEWYDLDDLTVYVHPTSQYGEPLADLATYWSGRTTRMLRICDLSALLEALEPHLQTTWKQWGDDRDGSVSLRIVDGGEPDGDAVRITYDAHELAVEPDVVDPDIELDRCAMTRLLFGGPERMRSVKAAFPVLGTLLPLEFHIPHSMYV